MDNFKELNVNELQQVSGGKYYGNGVYVNDDDGTVSVDWSQAWASIGNNFVASVAGGSAGIARPYAYSQPSSLSQSNPYNC